MSTLTCLLSYWLIVVSDVQRLFYTDLKKIWTGLIGIVFGLMLPVCSPATHIFSLPTSSFRLTGSWYLVVTVREAAYTPDRSPVHLRALQICNQFCFYGAKIAHLSLHQGSQFVSNPELVHLTK